MNAQFCDLDVIKNGKHENALYPHKKKSFHLIRGIKCKPLKIAQIEYMPWNRFAAYNEAIGYRNRFTVDSFHLCASLIVFNSYIKMVYRANITRNSTTLVAQPSI